ncbi:MAG: aminotransferase class III-fold pyridoxal phosphate-dependent enzyme, partial [Pseudomonadota bacterium]
MNIKADINDLTEVIEADKAHVWHHLVQHKKFETVDPLMIIEGKGLHVWNQAGRKHLDAVAGGVWTVNVGYGRERIADAVRDQILKMNFFGGTMGTVPGAVFAKMLMEKMPGMSRVFYANSGSEANEKAYKMVRQIAHQKYGGKKTKILFRERDYHGTTLANLSAGGHEQRGALYGPYAPDFVKVPHCLEYRSQWGDVDDYGLRAANAIEDVILREGPDTVGAIILEPITAGGGVIVPPDGYWERVQEICKQYNVLLIMDEVVCGMGRTGKWFGY